MPHRGSVPHKEAEASVRDLDSVDVETLSVMNVMYTCI